MTLAAAELRSTMASAIVGNSFFGEETTTTRLEEKMADISYLFYPFGTDGLAAADVVRVFDADQLGLRMVLVGRAEGLGHFVWVKSSVGKVFESAALDAGQLK